MSCRAKILTGTRRSQSEPTLYRIVVVEDSETQAFKLRLLLEEQGWEVSIAGAAEAALAALGDPLPDLIMVDYNLPGMRGDEFCRRIRMNLNTRGIPLLMMTGSAPETAEIQSLESGADGYISKSENPEILLLRIRALLRKALGAGRHSEFAGFRLPQRPHLDHRRQPHLSRISQRGTAESRL